MVKDGIQLEYFMWRWQHLFQISCKTMAESIARLLDPALLPELFLLGFRVEGADGVHPICVFPEDEIDPSDFREVPDQAAAHAAADPDRRMIHSLPEGEAANAARIRQRAWSRAIRDTMGRRPQTADRIAYVSSGVRVAGYRVYVVLTLEKATVSRYPALHHDVRDKRYAVSVSLIDAAMTEFLSDCARALSMDEPGSGLDVVNRHPEEILRRAGLRLMATPAWAVRTFEGIHGLFPNLNAIAWLRYEGTVATGWIDIVRRDAAHCARDLILAAPVSLRRHRHVRKLLSMTSDGVHLLCDGESVFATGRILASYDPKEETAFEVRFSGAGVWELRHGGLPLMWVRNGVPQLPRALLALSDFTEKYGRVLSGTPAQAEAIWPAVEAVLNEHHGALLVISADAETEAKRLAGQSTLVEPIPVSCELLRAASRIDGATLLDPKGRVRAIGVILDGEATAKGDTSRGSRYNSAVRYLERKHAKALAVVVSEDGTVDLLPNLQPRIRREWISEALQALDHEAAAEEPSHKHFSRAMDQLSGLEFYLSLEQCSRANDLRRTIEAKFARANPMAPRLIREDLAPDPEMNDSYFLEEGAEGRSADHA